MSGRDSVLRGATIELTAVFFDAAGEPADPSGMSFSIYPPGHNPELGATTAEAWVYGVSLTSGGSGPEANASNFLEKTSTGHYKYSFTVPTDSDIGSSFDRWEATLDSESLDETFNFVVVGGGSVATTKLYENNIIYIQLSSTIAALDGSTLPTDEFYFFTTTYNPLYASARQVRLDLGPFVAHLPDDTLNLAIYEAGRDADINCFQLSTANANYLSYSKARYTLLTAELTLLRALSGDSIIASRMSKTLGDLSVSRGGNLTGLERRAEELRLELEGLRRAIRTGGDISPGTSLRSEISVKGAAADAIVVARQWGTVNSQPLANSRTVAVGRRALKTYDRRF